MHRYKLTAGYIVILLALLSLSIPAWADQQINLTDAQKEAVLMNSYASDGQVQMQCRDAMKARFTNTPNVYLKSNSNDLVYVPEKIFLQCMNIYMKFFPENVKKLKDAGVDLREIMK